MTSMEAIGWEQFVWESIVCLEAKTGRRVWHFQIVHHGVWDYDTPAAPILHDMTVDGRRIKAVTLLTKQNMSFVFDRVTGKPVWPIEERPVPQVAVPGERHSPTQPFPTKPAPYSPQGYHEEGNPIDFTPELRAEALEIAKRYVRGPMYMPTTVVVEGGTQGTWMYPGYGGGSNWNGGAFDPENGTDVCADEKLGHGGVADQGRPSVDELELHPRSNRVHPRTARPSNQPATVECDQCDGYEQGEHVWSRSIGGAPDSIRNHPALKGLKLDFDKMGQPGVRPGPLATKTLLFLAEAGNLSGDPGGPMFRAYDKRTGDVIAEIALPSKASGAPMTYLYEGRQYIVIAVSTQQHPAELVGLALPGGQLWHRIRHQRRYWLPMRIHPVPPTI